MKTTITWRIIHKERPDHNIELKRELDLPFVPQPGVQLTFEATGEMVVDHVKYRVPEGTLAVSGYLHWGSDADALAARDRRIEQWAAYGWQRASGS